MKIGSNKNPFGGIIIGILFLIGGSILLWWNEGNNVKNIKTVKELKEKVVDVGSDKISSSNEGKLVATNGEFNVRGDELSDYSFSVNMRTAKLKRVVEMYQWKEKEEEDDNDNTRYTYEKEWSTDIIDSSDFNNTSYSNPTSMLYNTESFYADSVEVGAFSLSKEQIEDLPATKSLTIGSDVYLPTGFTVNNNYITNSTDLNNPQIGDLRISYKYNDYKQASVLAVQNGNSFVDFISSQGKRINSVDEGILTSSQMINNIEKSNNMMKWILRGIGVLLIVIGYLALISPITTLTSFVPILGGIVGGALNLISFLIGLVHSLIIIIIAWFRYRPLLSICLLVVVVGLIVLIRNIIKKQKGSQQNMPTNSINQTSDNINNNIQQPVNTNIPQDNSINNSQNIVNNNFQQVTSASTSQDNVINNNQNMINNDNNNSNNINNS